MFSNCAPYISTSRTVGNLYRHYQLRLKLGDKVLLPPVSHCHTMLKHPGTVDRIAPTHPQVPQVHSSVVLHLPAFVFLGSGFGLRIGIGSWGFLRGILRRLHLGICLLDVLVFAILGVRFRRRIRIWVRFAVRIGRCVISGTSKIKTSRTVEAAGRSHQTKKLSV